METSINIKEIESYSLKFSKKICDEFFAQKEKINGNEILELCDIIQINLLVLKNLFENWLDSSEKMKSPYFNYESVEVRELYSKYSNTLSRNILIDRENFEPLLSESVKEIFLLIFSPYEFYSHFINDDKRHKIRLTDLKNLKKYVKINSHLLDDLIVLVEKDGRESLFIDEVYELFNEVCESTKEDPEDITQYLESLSNVVPLKAEQIYLEDPSEKVTETNDKESDNSDSGIINEQYVDEKTPLMEKFSNEQSTLADWHEKMGIESIKKNISINQKFLFVKELFNENDEEFLDFITRLDSCNDYDGADQIMKSEYLERDKWDVDSEAVKEFIEIIEKRFKS